MPRYLQKLVARAGVAPFPASLKPAFRAEATDAAGHDPLPEVVEPLPPIAPASSEDRQSAAIMTPTPSEAPLHTIEIRSESIEPAPQVIRERTVERFTESRIETSARLKTEISQDEHEIAKAGIESPQAIAIPRIEPKPASDVAQETPPVIPVIASPATDASTRNVQDAKPQPETGQRPTERDVLAKLMPRLEAWFNQPSRVEEHSENDAPEVHLAPPPSESASASLLSQDETRLVIGEIRVEVLPPPLPAPVLPPQVIRIPARSAQSSATGTIAKLGFGLGQM